MPIPKPEAGSLDLKCQQRSATGLVLLETSCFYRAAPWALACKWRPKHGTPARDELRALR